MFVTSHDYKSKQREKQSQSSQSQRPSLYQILPLPSPYDRRDSESRGCGGWVRLVLHVSNRWRCGPSWLFHRRIIHIRHVSRIQCLRDSAKNEAFKKWKLWFFFAFYKEVFSYGFVNCERSNWLIPTETTKWLCDVARSYWLWWVLRTRS